MSQIFRVIESFLKGLFSTSTVEKKRDLSAASKSIETMQKGDQKVFELTVFPTVEEISHLYESLDEQGIQISLASDPREKRLTIWITNKKENKDV